MPIITKLSKLTTFCLDTILRIGQMQLLRKKICFELNNGAKFDSKHLLHALNTFNKALMAEINAHFEDPKNPYPDEENPLLYELNPYLECVGLSEPLKKIYIMTNKCEYISFFVSMLVLSQLAKLPSVKLNVPVFKGSSTQTAQNPANVPMITVTITNAICLVIGCITLLKQFNPDFRNQFIGMLAQYVRSTINFSDSQRPTDLPVDTSKIISFLEDFVDFSELDRKVSLFFLFFLDK